MGRYCAVLFIIVTLVTFSSYGVPPVQGDERTPAVIACDDICDETMRSQLSKCKDSDDEGYCKRRAFDSGKACKRRCREGSNAR
jgi:hypothetical protein